MARRRRLLAKTMGLLLGIALLTPAMSMLQATAAHADPGSEEARFFSETNQLRVSHGLNPLASYGGLVSIARSWSGNMASAGQISHNMSLPSPHHYENLVDPVFNYVGIGVVDSGGRIWVTVDFMQLNNAPAAASPAPVQRAARPRTTAAPRPAPVPQPVPVTAPPASTPGAASAPGAALAMSPTPALILALEQVRAADR